MPVASCSAEARRCDDIFDHLLRRAGADAVHEQQDAVPGHGVARVLDDAQIGDEILDVRGFDELEPAELHEGDIGLVQLDLQVEGEVAGAEEDGDVLQGDALLAEFEDLLDDEARLEVLGLCDHDARKFAAGLLGEELLGVFVRGCVRLCLRAADGVAECRASASRTAAICSGVVPQHPPMMRAPCLGHMLLQGCRIRPGDTAVTNAASQLSRLRARRCRRPPGDQGHPSGAST